MISLEPAGYEDKRENRMVCMEMLQRTRLSLCAQIFLWISETMISCR